MPHNPGEEDLYTREHLLQVLANGLGAPASDPRILDACDRMIREWSQLAPDPEAACARYLRSGPVASRVDIVAAQCWALTRVLL